MNATLKARYDSKATRIIATTNDVDRDGEVVDPRGVQNLDAYLRGNPVILWQHKHDQAPVGKATGAEVYDDRIELNIDWAPTPMGKEVKALYDGGYMSSFSIGFIPKRSENKGEQFTWTEWELLEVSAVSIPANPMANVIRSAEGDGLTLPTLKSLKGDTMGTIDQQIEELQRQLDEKTAQREAAKNIGQNRDPITNPRVKVGENPEYRGINLRKAADVFATRREQKGDFASAKRIRGDEQKAFSLLRGFQDLVSYAQSTTPGVQKDMTESTTTAGGYLTPDQRDSLLFYARQSSVALRNARVIRMSSDKMKVPRETSQVTLGFTSETTEAAETSATFDEVSLDATDLDGYADVSMHLEMDSAEPIAALLLDQFTEAYAQNVDSAVFAGTGDPVSGIFLSYGQSEVFSGGSTSFSEVLAANLFNAVGKLPRHRRAGGKWFIGREALWNYVRQLQDSNGRFYLVDNFAESAAGRLLGFPVEETEYYAADGAGAAMAVFGNLRSFIIGDRLSNLTLFRDPYSLSAQHYVRYVFWTRVAFANALPNDQVAIVTAAT